MNTAAVGIKVMHCLTNWQLLLLSATLHIMC